MLGKRKIGMLLGSMAVVVALGTGCAANPDQTAGGADSSAQHEQDGSGKRDRGQRGGFGRISLQNNADLLSLLKVDDTKLQDELKAGKTIADIAKEQGVSEDDVVKLLVEQRKEQLKKEVTDGKMTQEQADKMSEQLESSVKNMVEGKMGQRGGRGGGNPPSGDQPSDSQPST